MDGTCDVPGCSNETYMGWRPLTEALGRQVCEDHWRRHKDPNGSFNLWDAFGFRKPAPTKGFPEPVPELDRGRTVLAEPHFAEEAKKRQKARKGDQPGATLEKLQNLPVHATEQVAKAMNVSHGYVSAAKKLRAEAPENPPGCRACGAEREPGHTYCRSCANERRKITRRQAQSRYRKKQRACCASE